MKKKNLTKQNKVALALVASVFLLGLSTVWNYFLLDQQSSLKQSTQEDILKVKLVAEIAVTEKMAEIEEELANQTSLAKSLAKHNEEIAATASTASTAAYQSKLANDAMVEELANQTALAKSLAKHNEEIAATASTAEYQSKLANDAMVEELANQTALAKFLAKLNKERAAAATSTAAYQSKLTNDAMETLKLLSARMEKVSKELRFATSQIQDELSFHYLPNCSDKLPYLTDRDL